MNEQPIKVDEVEQLDEATVTLIKDLTAQAEEVAEAILAENPSAKRMLQAIHAKLKQYPEAVHLLSEQHIGLIVQAMITIADVELGPKEKKAKGDKVSSSAKAIIKTLDADSI